ncbi:hypothetical protein FDF74_08790 [Clostridium niameyense]|uniref:Uncharacterized protein n=1 Tax=Clostridium niameyense TaxID=1622073 RepID=A0A6M0RBX7_9CLOT|nr:hypothetical protein [Clostridium niameyense]NEZ47297.1 hypothetical protein [Clostridium niameyense]
MKKKSKCMYVLMFIIFIFQCSYNIYQHNKISGYKRQLKIIVINNLQQFASMDVSKDNEIIYAEQYASIVAAQEAYALLGDGKGIPSEEYDSTLAKSFIQIKRIMLNDKEKFKKIFGGMDASNLIFKISDDFEDKDSIIKLNKLLSD